MKSWLDISPNSDFSLHNLPYGIFSRDGSPPAMGIAIGEYVMDMAALYRSGEMAGLDISISLLVHPDLNPFIAAGKEIHDKLRKSVLRWLTKDEAPTVEVQREILLPATKVTMHMPVTVGDYTDFYSSRQHATNVGSLFRDPDNALLPNWLHMPVAYHGRASSIVVSGTPVTRPKGQTLPPGADNPVFGPSQRLDFELELGFVIGKNSVLGEPVPVEEAEDYIFGAVLFNDWSARDIQKWEYVPLGPFLGKNFASTVSPWIVPLEALQAFVQNAPTQDPKVLPYLWQENRKLYNLHLEVLIQPNGGANTTICRSNSKNLYWTVAQQLAHHTVNGCNVRVGDIIATGTISGSESGSYGSLLEITRSGKEPVKLEGGVTRAFIEDGDTVTLKGWGEKEGKRIGFGEAKGTIVS